MTATDRDIASTEAILLAFSVEPDQGPATLQRYLVRYPHLTTELLDLSLDLEFSDRDEVADDGALDTPQLAEAWATFKEISASAAQFTPEVIQAIYSAFTTPAMRQIGLPVSVLQAIRNGGALAEGFPRRWLVKIAAVAGVANEMFRLYLQRPSQLSAAVSYKSSSNPAAPQKVSFGELVASTKLTDAEKAAILSEEE